ncbi:similar to Saccharomyces cerevisiae YPL190C NAB3 Single stranded RNA binding protein [Maudiozyma saulgeensis]|uniref:Similar to Saccharomyces cerevisiae YPL190C NAB3 Single stranded RNA binding protein n=1 Tax=Maudiozyma saulgeensis TaxID=1789683 RepID=A0A1X7R7S5_9SACH|nr:similar to Saccharomyces cerevisiae YPL190C NAB3 Single stranded RNA binding protein [Kazachstania saulgeensis]
MSEPIENTGIPMDNVPAVPTESLPINIEQQVPAETLNSAENVNESVDHTENQLPNENSESDHDSETANLYNEDADAPEEDKNEEVPQDNNTNDVEGEEDVKNGDEEEGEGESNDDEDDDDDDGSDDGSDSSESSDSSSEESETSNAENEEEEKIGTSEGSNQESGSAEIKEPSTTETSTSENQVTSLLERQMEYMKESRLLEDEQFKQLSDQERTFSILKLLSTNPATKIPNSNSVLTPSSVHVPQAPIESTKIQSDYPPQQENMTSGRADLNAPMSAHERELYDIYLQGENKITEMHNIPPKSRLFIGNLPLKNVTKEDLFRIFHPYGHILQINIKNAFGFIQYDNHQSVINAIKVESEQMNFGKKLILEVSSSNARPQFDHGDHGANSSSTFISTSKRPFDNDDYGATDNYRDNSGNSKRTKRRVPECLIFVRRTADRAYATEIFNSIKNGTGLETDMMFLKPRMELWKLVNDAAFDGTWGVILVNKTHDVDIQTFYKGPQGETKFDEYVGVSAQDAVGIFNNLKTSRKGGSRMQHPTNNSGFGYGQPSMGMPPAQQQQQQGYYGNYNIPQQQGYGMPLPPSQNYGMAPPQQGYGMSPPPPMMGQSYGRYQNSQNYNGYQNMPIPPQNQPPPMPQNNQLSSLLGGNPGQMDQQQLLGALQNLPPNVIANLLASAQQQQPQQPNQQQQLVGLLQSAQQQQQNPSRYSQNTAIPNQHMGSNDYNQDRNPNMNSRQDNPPQQSPQDPNAGGNNVQNLLDSLAKLQK